MLDPSVLPGFLTAIILITAAPGPDNAYIAAVAIDRGRGAGLLSAAGMALGMTVHVTAAALGLALLLRSAPWAVEGLRLAGGSYLAGLAIATLRSAHGSQPTGHAPPSARQVLRRAVLTNLTNPKVLLFFAAFLPQFVRAGHGPMQLQLLTLGLLFLLVGLTVDSAVGLLAGTFGDILAPGGRAATVFARLAGLTFATLALLLFAEAVRQLSSNW